MFGTTNQQGEDMASTKFHRVIWGITDIKSKEKGSWTQLGVTFLNKDGSENLLFNFYPTDPAATIQLREQKDKKEE